MKSVQQRFVAATLLILALATCGCGPAEPTVIQHTEDYQLTEAEQVNKDAEEEARKQGN